MTTRRLGATVDAIDFFCGFGGSAQGIRAAGADLIAAANHSQIAIDCHSRNFKNVEHYRADLVDPESADYMDPADLPAARFAWFSPGCTHHSPANAKKLYQRGRQTSLFEEEDFDEVAYANSERSRVTMSCVLRYVERNRPEILVVENVVEVTLWGPDRDGSTFAWWKRTLENMGYEIECLFLNSQFFPPCPQSRDRLYIVAWRAGNSRPNLDYRPLAFCTSQRCGGRHVYAVQTWKRPTKAWPLRKWGKYKRQYVYCCPDCSAQVEPAAFAAYSAINWSNLGPKLGGERSELGMNQLATATVERIRRALAKFGRTPPFIIPTKSVWGSDRSVTQPFTAQTTQQDKAVVSAVIKNNGSLEEAKYRASSPATTLGALTTNPTQALVTAAIVPQRFDSNPTSTHDKVPTVTTKQSDLTLASMILAAAGNTYERPGYTRARHVADQLYTQHTTPAFGFASTPSLIEMRGGGSVQAGQHPVTNSAHTVTAGGLHHGLVSTPLLLNGQDNESVHTVTQSLHTVRANGGAGRLISPALFAKFNGGPSDTAWHSTADPFNTVTARDTHGLVVLPWIDDFRADPVAVTRQLATLMSQLRGDLESSPQIPVEQITEEDLMNTRFRMLEPDPELRLAMAFDPDYILLGNKTQMTTGLGNAVTPPVATWITARCLETLGALIN
ncbi:MAG TPA: DNA cytosine methyltransferase [Pyrinomonadaceae bacterium]|nr:DNA cytosine methyltransferase [Pyrinomonadaceae bacterium]